MKEKEPKKIEVSRELIDECKEFWKWWAEKNPREWENITRGKPQFKNVKEEHTETEG